MRRETDHRGASLSPRDGAGRAAGQAEAEQTLRWWLRPAGSLVLWECPECPPAGVRPDVGPPPCSRPTLCPPSLAPSPPTSTLSCRLTLGGPGGPSSCRPSPPPAGTEAPGVDVPVGSRNELVGGETFGSKVQLRPRTPEETEETRLCPLPPTPAAGLARAPSVLGRLAHISLRFWRRGVLPCFHVKGAPCPESQVITLQGRRRHRVRVARRGRQSRPVPETHTPQPGAAGPLPSTPSVAARQLSWMAESRLRSGVPKLDALPPPQQLPDLLHLWPLPAAHLSLFSIQFVRKSASSPQKHA